MTLAVTPGGPAGDAVAHAAALAHRDEITGSVRHSADVRGIADPPASGRHGQRAWDRMAPSRAAPVSVTPAPRATLFPVGRDRRGPAASRAGSTAQGPVLTAAPVGLPDPVFPTAAADELPLGGQVAADQARKSRRFEAGEASERAAGMDTSSIPRA